MSDSLEGRSYRGLPGAFPYAFRQSDSLVFKLYVLVSALVTFFITIIFTFAVIGVIGQTEGGTASLSLSRSFVALVGLLVVLPMVAPIILVARRHRRGTGHDSRYDRQLALTGFAFFLSVYVGLVLSTPAAYQQPVDGHLPTIVYPVYGLPTLLGLLPPLFAVAAIAIVHRRAREQP